MDVEEYYGLMDRLENLSGELEDRIHDIETGPHTKVERKWVYVRFRTSPSSWIFPWRWEFSDGMPDFDTVEEAGEYIKGQDSVTVTDGFLTDNRYHMTYEEDGRTVPCHYEAAEGVYTQYTDGEYHTEYGEGDHEVLVEMKDCIERLETLVRAYRAVGDEGFGNGLTLKDALLTDKGKR